MVEKFKESFNLCIKIECCSLLNEVTSHFDNACMYITLNTEVASLTT